MDETLFERTNREREEAAGLRPAKPKAPEPDKAKDSFSWSKPVDPELKAAQDKAKLRLLRATGR